MTFLQSGQSPQTYFFESELYEAAIGDIALPAKTGRVLRNMTSPFGMFMLPRKNQPSSGRQYAFFLQVPLKFELGDAFQFDRSEEVLLIGGLLFATSE